MSRPSDTGDPPVLRLGVYGGTFDPIHYGHLRCAWEIAEALRLDRLHMIPAGLPPLRGQPGADGQDRKTMLELGLLVHNASVPLICDARELKRQGLSYTIDTLEEIRAEAPGCALWFVVGEDAFARFDQWHRWEEFLDVTNLVIVPRPGFDGNRSPAIAAFTSTHLLPLERALDHTHGALIEMTVTPLAISATAIRELLQQGRDPRFLTPDLVIEYIRSRSLYEKSVQ